MSVSVSVVGLRLEGNNVLVLISFRFSLAKMSSTCVLDSCAVMNRFPGCLERAHVPDDRTEILRDQHHRTSARHNDR